MKPPGKHVVLGLIDDHAAFAELPEKVRTQVVQMLGWIHLLASAGHGDRGAIVRKATKALGVSAATINRNLGRYREQGWRGLVDHRSASKGRQGVPANFRSYVEAIFLRSPKVTAREVQQLLCERWRQWILTGEGTWAIPGYELPPPDAGLGYPEGWSEDTIARLRPDPLAGVLLSWEAMIRRDGEAIAAVPDSPLDPSRFPTAPGWYWWRQDPGCDWAAVRVMEDHTKPGSLLTASSEETDYQCNDDPENPWYGEWWPEPLRPPGQR